MRNKMRISAVVLAVSLLLMLSSFSVVLAQDNEATIIILPSAGGTTSPEPGTYVYAEDTQIALEATADEGFEFLYWVVKGEFTPNQPGQTEGNPNEVLVDGEPIPIVRFPEIDFLSFTANPAQITCGFGYTYQYQAVFVPIISGIQQPDQVIFDPLDTFGEWPMSASDISLVSVLSTIGGTTDPAVGRYVFGENAEPTLTLTATPSEGYEFQYWIVTGDYMPGHGGDASLDTNVIDVNPLEINHGMGHSYNYEAVFVSTEMMEPDDPTDTTDDAVHPFGLSSEILTALIVVLIVAVIVAVAFGLFMFTKRSR